MKKLRLLLLLSIAVLFAAGTYASNPDIIPLPKSVVQKEGFFNLKKGMTVGGGQLSDGMRNEIAKFVGQLNKTTALNVHVSKNNGNITVKEDASIASEGYRLSINPKRVILSASTPAGLFYGFQTIKHLLPSNVTAGLAATRPLDYRLPAMEIDDEPRFPYRGFMLDVSRHFFDTAQIKKMLDIMAVYKLNRFHWHLTDDQGWRLPVDKYPLLTEKGATNHNILLSDFEKQEQKRAGKDAVYGPYFYTKEQIREIVDYAADRHIEVIPEIDMPGHMVAAIHAYPEFSTDPQSKRALTAEIALDSDPISDNVESHFTHHIWNIQGVSKDVLDVSNPKVIQFCKDVIDAVAELFPSEYIHIGGDECPTVAWEKSESCQELKGKLGLKSDEALQTWFMKEIADYAKERHGRKIMAWNETVSSEGADRGLVKEIDPVIFCWFPPKESAALCEQEGLRHIYTPFNGGYYINRSYKGIDKIGAGRDGALELSYTHNPPQNSRCIGVQGTFWTEQVDRNRDLEYLALPRLIAIAEQGWTPSDRKNYEDFLRRLNADKPILDLGGYNYARHQLYKTE